MRTRAKKGRTRLTPEQQRIHDEQYCEKFNTEFPIGKKVWYFTVMPFGPVRETTVTEGAYMLPNGVAVCKVDGVRGWVSIAHIIDVDESRRSHLEFAK